MEINKIVSKALEDKGWLKLSPNDIKSMANHIVSLELDIQAYKKQYNIPDVVVSKGTLCDETESNRQNSRIATYTEDSKPEDYA